MIYVAQTSLKQTLLDIFMQSWIKTKLGLMLLSRKGPIFFWVFKADQDSKVISLAASASEDSCLFGAI